MQASFNIHEAEAAFLDNYKIYGFKDRSDMIHAALDQLRRHMEKDRLARSAELYSEIYHEDDHLKDLTDSAVHGWTE